MHLSRRRFLENAALAGTGIVAGSLLGSWPNRLSAAGSSSVVGNPLRFPPLFTGGDLVARITTSAIWPGTPTTVWTYGGSYPAPTIRLRRGERFEARLVNELPESTNVHWHGLLVPSAMDGHPSQLVAPGATKEFSFVVSQRAGTYWYHPHAHMLTAKQAYMGMAGFFIVDDPEHDALGLPSESFDVPLAIQDRELVDTRQLTYAPDPNQLMTGLLGNVVLVNGVAEAYHEVSRDLYRLRLLNGSNGRIMKLGFDNGATFHLIASDAGLLDRPYPMTSLMLAPGERAEILVDFASVEVGGAMTLRTLPYDNAPDYRWQGWGMDAVRFDVTAASRASAVVPEQLIPLERLDPGATARTRFFQLAMVHQMPNMKHTINGREYDVERIDERVPAGAVEYWDFFNSSDEPHPMHLHGAQLQVAERDGAASSAPKDKGWKDVVLVEAQQTVRAAVRFSDHLGVFVAHCHNLEHEDTGMMINFVVESSTGVGSERSDGAALEPIWPNPALDLVNVAFTLRAPAQASIEIADTSGRIVIETSLGELDAGRHQTTVDLRGLASGAYVTTLDVGGVRSREKLTKVE